MAKRGETRPYRIRFEWQGTGVKGTETRSTEREARDFAAQLCDNSDRRRNPISVTVEHCYQPQPILTIQHQPTDEEESW